jgi:predicted TIM-barrel fold metal-dependent hydrolase
MQKVFESHIHFPFPMFDAGVVPLSRDKAKISADAMIDCFVKANVVKACVLGARGPINEYVADMMKEYPEIVIGMAYLDMDQEPTSKIEEYMQKGFQGIKIINTQHNYNDPRYFEYYSEAERCGMRVLFHTGVIGNEVDYLKYSPFDRNLIPGAQEFEKKLGSYKTSSAYMLPIYLDTIAQRFPDLKIVGGHLGYGMYLLACSVARFRRNVFFDLSGGDVVKRHLLEKELIKKEISTFKLLYASDGLPQNLKSDIDGWLESFSIMGLTDTEINNIMYLNSARIYGVEEY